VTCCTAIAVPAAAPPAGADYLAWKRALLSQRTSKAGKDVIIANDVVRLGVGFEGAWGLATTGGDPADPSDDTLDLMFSLTGSSNSLALKIDGVLHVLDGSSPEITRAADGTYVTAAWTVDGLLLRARYELVDNGSGRADTAKVTYTVANPAPKATGEERSVSLKLGLDIAIGNDYPRLVTPAGILAVETGFGLSGGGPAYSLSVPDFWQGYQHDSLAAPGLIGQGTFAGGGATPPDKVVIGAWATVCDRSAFDYAPSNASLEGKDSAVALWWFDRTLAPGASASFVVLYGQGHTSRSAAGLALAVSAPATLGPAGSFFAPNPFSVLVQVQNLGAVDLLDLPVTLTLPGGLSVAAGGSASQSIAALASGAYGLLAFRLAASSEHAGQTLSYTVTAGTGESLVTLTRAIALPTAPPPVTITFLAGSNGTVSGAASQTLPIGSDTSAVTAEPDPEYHFVRWTRADALFSTANPLVLHAVQTDATLLAEFAVNIYTLRFEAAAGGTLDGAAVQLVPSGGSASAVRAVSVFGYVFQQWSDGSTANPRAESGVRADRSFVAQFRLAVPVPPNGEFLARVDESGHGLWDLSGSYALTVAGNPLVLNLVHDSSGKLTGGATYGAGPSTVVNLPIRGSVGASAGNTRAHIVLRGTDPARIVSLGLALDLTVNPSTRQLVGALTGSVTAAGTATPVAAVVAVPIPAPMDGTWTLLLQLTAAGRTVTGSAQIVLSNGAAYVCRAQGRTAGAAVVLNLAPAPGNQLGKGITARIAATPREGRLATLQAASIRAYGQTRAW
jgi:hypothetical protein